MKRIKTLGIFMGVAFSVALSKPAYSASYSCTAGDADCLIQSILSANANTEPDTINLEPGTYTLTTAFDSPPNWPYPQQTGLPPITSPITINGSGAGTVIERDMNADRFRIMEVSQDGVLNLNGLVLRNGMHQDALRYGGAIYNEGEAHLIDCTITNNEGPSYAGGIKNNGTMTLVNCTVSGNRTYRGEGDGYGGGIANTGDMTLTNCTVSGNSAFGGGGGIHNGSTSRLNLINCTVSDNQSDYGSGGINNRDINPGVVTLLSTIVAGNSIFSDGNDDCSSLIDSQGHNLVGFETGCPSDGTGDLTVDPDLVFINELGPLQNNGGPTDTHALLPGSQAIDAGCPDCPPPATDQRGSERPQGTACDIGAFEAAGFLPLPFAAFNIKILLKNNNQRNDGFLAKGSFTLSDDSNGIDPPIESVFFSIANADGQLFAQTLPIGSFKPLFQGGFLFHATGESLGIHSMVLMHTGVEGKFKFKVLVDKIDFANADLTPVTVTLQIGDDGGVRMVNAGY